MIKSLVQCPSLLIMTLLILDIKVAAQEGPGIVIAHPGQNVELLCTVTESSTSQTTGWLVNNEGPYRISSLRNGILTGYTATSDSSNLIVVNIMMNDGRNGSQHRCVIVPAQGMVTFADIIDESDPTTLYVAGVPAVTTDVIVRIRINGNSISLTLSWREPFNNLDPIVNYIVSCSDDVTCPPNFTTTDNTTRSYTITNLTPMTNYTFSVVATNSIGSGKAGVVMITTPGATYDVKINGNDVTLTLSWGEPFNNFDPIVNYTVSCSGDVTCPPDFTTTDNTTRSYTITNLTPITNYTFSVVATNSIGSVEAGVVHYTTLGIIIKGPSSVTYLPGFSPLPIELTCNVTGVALWSVNDTDYRLASLTNGELPGHNHNGTNILINSPVNNTEYICVSQTSEGKTRSDPAYIIIAGVPTTVPSVAVDNNTININGSNVTLTLSWGEPFNNFDPIVNYTVSCSGDVTCPSSSTTTDNTTRSYTITNLTPMTDYTFSVVATNSIGSGKAGVVMITISAIDEVSGITINCNPLDLMIQCVAEWNPVTQGAITGYQVYYNGTMMIQNVNSSTTTLTFTAPSLPDGVFIGTVVVMVTAMNRYGVGPSSAATMEIEGTSVSSAMSVLSMPNASSILQSITVTCTIHSDSTADQCVVMAMADGGVTATGFAPVTNAMATVAVDRLECGVTYTIIAGGTLNGHLVGPRSSHGTIPTNPCPVCPVTDNCDSNDNGAIIGAVVGVDCVVIIIMVITNIMVWICCFRKRHHTEQHSSTKLHTPAELHGPTKDTVNPAYNIITDDQSKGLVEKPVSYYVIEDVNKPPEVKMSPNPAYGVH